MLINESIVFPPGGSKMVPLPFPAASFFMCVSRLFLRQSGRAAALWRECGARRSIMILISSNQEPSAQLKNSNHAHDGRAATTLPPRRHRAAATAGDRNISTYSDCVECGAE